RSFPFVSKASGHNFVELATKAMLGSKTQEGYQTLELDHVAVKSPQFSYNRLKGADPVAGVEMASTGEVACFGDTIEEAFFASWQATDQHIRSKRLFLSLPDEQKHKFIDETAELLDKGWDIYTSSGTHDYLLDHGVKTKKMQKISENKTKNVGVAISGG